MFVRLRQVLTLAHEITAALRDQGKFIIKHAISLDDTRLSQHLLYTLKTNTLTHRPG